MDFNQYICSHFTGTNEIIVFYTFQWPYCDGSHANHNKECGDNLGPVVLKHNPDKK